MIRALGLQRMSQIIKSFQLRDTTFNENCSLHDPLEWIPSQSSARSSTYELNGRRRRSKGSMMLGSGHVMYL